LFDIPAVVGLGYDGAAGKLFWEHAGHVVAGAEYERDTTSSQHRRDVPGRLAVKIDVKRKRRGGTI